MRQCQLRATANIERYEAYRKITDHEFEARAGALIREFEEERRLLSAKTQHSIELLLEEFGHVWKALGDAHMTLLAYVPTSSRQRIVDDLKLPPHAEHLREQLQKAAEEVPDLSSELYKALEGGGLFRLAYEAQERKRGSAKDQRKRRPDDRRAPLIAALAALRVKSREPELALVHPRP
ncbi:MAG: hypothetical protein DMD91_27865 [Candidatus Rokuibacteriota bacterium]|nr:MAG: hypothetical protein DMD91_27865 [Candidatus Rokubacteria bacterium]